MVYYQKYQFGYILEGLGFDNNGISSGHSVYFTTIWYSFRPFGAFCVHMLYFPRFGMFYQEKSGNPGHNMT
jgi:hypothetical protein